MAQIVVLAASRQNPGLHTQPIPPAIRGCNDAVIIEKYMALSASQSWFFQHFFNDSDHSFEKTSTTPSPPITPSASDADKRRVSRDRAAARLMTMIFTVGLHGSWPILNSSMATDRSMRPWRMQTMLVAMSPASARSWVT